MDKSLYFRRGKRCSIELQVCTDMFAIGIGFDKIGIVVGLGIFHIELAFKR